MVCRNLLLCPRAPNSTRGCISGGRSVPDSTDAVRKSQALRFLESHYYCCYYYHYCCYVVILFCKVQIGMLQSDDSRFLKMKLQRQLVPVVHGARLLGGAQSGREMSSLLLSKSSGTPQKPLAVFIPHAAAAQNSEPVPVVCDSLPLIFTCYLKQSRKGAVLLCQLSPAVLKGFFLQSQCQWRRSSCTWGFCSVLPF